MTSEASFPVTLSYTIKEDIPAFPTRLFLCWHPQVAVLWRCELAGAGISLILVVVW